jgi:hypothetical protein
LRGAGYAAAQNFIETHWDAIGARSSVDLSATYGG